MHLTPHSAAVWSADRRVVIPLAVLTAAHWALVIAGTQLLSPHTSSITNLKLPAPAIVPSIQLSSSIFSITPLFYFTTVFEVIIFALTFGKLFFPRRPHTQFAKQILEDGILYFIVVYVPAFSHSQSAPSLILNIRQHWCQHSPRRSRSRRSVPYLHPHLRT